MSDPTGLLAMARAWMEDDPDPATRKELADLIARGPSDELADRFRGRLEFGTAGLRGVLGAGPNRMNRAVVRAATAGFCAYLAQEVPGARERGIAIGYDGRRGSTDFAGEAAEVALGAGFRVFLFDRPVPTPIVGFTCLARRAAGGVVVTASHNPPEYNGYKVYWENGAQIIPPQDHGIAAAIDRVGPLGSVPRTSADDGEKSGRLERLGEPAIAAYHDAIASLVEEAGPGRGVGIAYTALHGVGDVHVRRALSRAGFAHVRSVAAQAEPDGAFPTVRFPNPEEKGAMDLVLALAKESGAPLVIANDPDADRLAVAARKPDGSYVQLTGNEVGCLLGHALLSRSEGGQRVVVSSMVSSPMLGAIARAHGARWEETLTGFKWIANRGIELEREGFRFVFGYEEALGYTVGTVVRDKDGVGAALVFADLCARVHAEGRDLFDELDVCARRYGLYLSRQVSVTKKGEEGAAQIRQTMAKVRAAPPKALGRYAVEAFVDVEQRTKTRRDGTVEALALPSSNVIALELEGGHRVMLRPSGTEPKIKYYFDVREAIGEREHTASARERGERVLSELVEAFLAVVGEG